MSVRVDPALVGAAVLAAVTSVGLITPAAMAAPKLPDGCTFDGATGTSTCITTTTGEETDQVVNEGNQPVGDTYADKFCSSRIPNYVGYGSAPGTTTVSAQTTKTTTSTFQGAYNKNKPVTTTAGPSITTYTIGNGIGTFGCFIRNPDFRPSDPGALPWLLVRFNVGDKAIVTN